jgi:antagonist of KipI
MGARQTMMTITKPGMLTTIQDLGRNGYQKYGVITSGVMDPSASRIANILVGNQEKEATLEITLLGPVIEFSENALISICGGDLSPSIDGRAARLWRPLLVKKGSRLQFGQCKSGCRCYLAVAGGFSVRSVMGSKSTYLRAGIGGVNGRALKSGDRIPIDSPRELSTRLIQHLDRGKTNRTFVESDWSVVSSLYHTNEKDAIVHVIKGRQFNLFTIESQKLLFTEPFEVTSQSDRMGYRLKGPTLALEKPKEMISEAVDFGTIQVPSEGNPIVLLADRQTTGGYPKIGQIATVDLSLLAQTKPGESLRFIEITHAEAEHLYLKKESNIQLLKNGVLLKCR